MNGIKDVQNRLLDQAAKEQSFRKQIVTDIAELLRNPDTDPVLKLFTVLVLLVVVCISFLSTLFILYAALKSLPSFGYVLVIPGLVVLLMILAIPLVLKASSTEQSLRLNHGFNKIYEARFGK